MLVSAFPLVIAAEEAAEKEYTYLTDKGSLLKPTKSNKLGADKYYYKTGEYEKNGQTYKISSAEDKLALMDYRYGNDQYELYVDAYSGEVAVVNKETGESLFTNPYNVGSTNANDQAGSTKDRLLSQLVVNYTEITTGLATDYYSYTEAANKGQIIVKSIKGGIRVEYAIGRVESRSLLPRLFTAERAEAFFATIDANVEATIAEKLADPDADFNNSDAEDLRYDIERFKGYYGTKISLSTAESDSHKEALLLKYPKLEKFDLYALDDSNLTAEAEIKSLENIIRTYHPDYSFEELDEAHLEVGYEGAKETTPLFRMALEYTLDEQGLVVRLPANGIRFNESLYRLNYIEILPYMGAGTNPNPGYTFFPDGSGALFDFEDIALMGIPQRIPGEVYGEDFAYHQITGRYEEIIRYPVYGLVETETLSKTVVDENGVETTQSYQKDRGFVAIVEEGDSLLEISSDHGGQTHKYNSIVVSARPRPTDSYNIADAISVGTDTTWTVVSSRKYTGNYKIRYIMLTDDDVAEEKGITDYYTCSYVGMAKAYRKYLEDNGTLNRLTEDEVETDIPLYIETFGALMTTERILSIPFNVMTPLTSFQDIATMYEQLKDKEISNVNFIMSGYTKGGMTNGTMPYNLKWEKTVSDDMDFEELLEMAKEEGFGLFPDFDFVFASNNTMFDGLSLKKHAVKTIDNRYTSKREYSATRHTHVSYFQLAISPAYFDHFYEKFVPKYQSYEPIGISVSTLGSYLNSDFDEDEPYNRDDSMQDTIKAFQYIREQFANAEVMTSGGNAYSWKYVDHITDIALDSSRYSVSCASVPFLGIVLHGYVELAGSATNMEGNLDYAFLKSLENGASMKFILSYRNTANLKEYETLSKYYSVRYDIWFNDVVSMYHELNELLRGVQTSTIEEHSFLDGVRIPDDDELAADAMQVAANKIATETANANAAAEAKRKEILNARKAIEQGTELIKSNTLAADYEALKALIAELNTLIAAADAKQQAYKVAQEAHADAKAAVTEAEEALKQAEEALTANPEDAALIAAVDAAKATLQTVQDAVEKKENEGTEEETVVGTRPTRDAAKEAAKEAATKVTEQKTLVYEAATALLNEYNALLKTYRDAKVAMALLTEAEAFTADYRAYLQTLLDDADFNAAYNALLTAGYANTEKADSVIALAKQAGVEVKALQDKVIVNETDTTKDEYAISGISTLINGEAFVYVAPEQEGGSGGTGSVSGGNGTTTVVTDKYDAANYMIVYERYSNGTEFILNFNDYRVGVTYNGITYTVDAYGYIVLSLGA